MKVSERLETADADAAVSRRTRSVGGLRAKLFAFNCLLVILPVGGLLFLDTHERVMLVDQERAMAEIGRVLAASLSRSSALDVADIEQTLLALERGTGARIRVLDESGRIMADSSVLGPPNAPGASARDESSPAASRWLYRLGAAPIRWWREWRSRAENRAPGYESADRYTSGGALTGSEVRAALAGGYGAATRISAGGQRSLTLYSALPIRRDGIVIGAVLVSQSTWRILRSLHQLRLEIARVLAASLLAAGALSLLVSRTIARPLGRLRDEAEKLLDRTGRVRGRFTALERRDEIGALARSLESLGARLEERVGAMERFAVELDHEFRNPLASVRNVAELLVDSHDADERRRLCRWIERDVARMQHILGGVREIGRRDAGRAAGCRESIDLIGLIAGVVEGCRRRTGVSVRLLESATRPRVWACPEGLCQVFENLIENAVSFGGESGVEIDVGVEGDHVMARVLDRGPGIAPNDFARVFERFYSRRPSSAACSAEIHAGLGLSIVRAIVEDEGGSVRVRARSCGGASFEVRLPLPAAEGEQNPSGRRHPITTTRCALAVA